MAAEKQWQYQGAQPSSLAALASSQKWTHAVPGRFTPPPLKWIPFSRATTQGLGGQNETDRGASVPRVSSRM